MKSGSKVLIGVLSVAALVGTGVATWTVGGGYHEKETETVTPEIATIGSRDVDLDVVIDADEGDHPIRFDNPSLQDLSVTYHVTGKKGADAADDFDPFTYNYSTVASEYQPNLSWETTVYRDGSPVGKDDAFFDYVVAPKGEMKYSVWLISGGKDVTLTFEWSEEILGGLNPQIYINEHKSQYPTKDAQTEFFTKLNEALDVTFKFTFKVGGLTETPVETPTTGEVTLPTVENGTLSIEGMTGNTIPAGEHTITITTNEGYVLTDNKLSVIENGETKEVTMTENALTRAASHTYTGKYDFKENATYNFSYAVEEETVVTPVEKYAVTFNQPENGTITVTSGETSLTSGALVDENTEVTYVVTPSEGYHIASITVNGKAVEEFDNTSYTGTVTVTSATSISATMEADAVEPQIVESGKFGLWQSTNHEALYFTGEMDGFYLGTTADYDSAVTIDVISQDEGVYLKFNGEEKYIGAEYALGDDNKYHTNILIQETPYVWSFNEEYDAYTTNLNNTDYYIGNYSYYDTLSLSKIDFITNEGNNVAHVVQEEIQSPAVASLEINNMQTELELGKTLKISTTVLPKSAIQDVSYAVTSGSEYAEVDETGVVTPKAEGQVTITVTTKGLNNEGKALTKTINLTIIPNSGVATEQELTLNFADLPRTTSGSDQIVYDNEFTITHAQGESSNSPRPNQEILRFYTKNLLNIESKENEKITKITLKVQNISDYWEICDLSVNQASDAESNDISESIFVKKLEDDSYTVTFSYDDGFTYLSIIQNGNTQTRFESITITYLA